MTKRSLLWNVALKHVVILLVLIFSIMHTNRYAEGSECDTAVTTRDMLICLESRLQNANEQLTKLKIQLEKVLTQEQVVALEKAHSTWLSYRDSNCAGAESLYKDGSMQPIVSLGCKVRMTDQRTEELLVIYEEILRGAASH